MLPNVVCCVCYFLCSLPTCAQQQQHENVMEHKFCNFFSISPSSSNELQQSEIGITKKERLCWIKQIQIFFSDGIFSVTRDTRSEWIHFSRIHWTTTTYPWQLVVRGFQSFFYPFHLTSPLRLVVLSCWVQWLTMNCLDGILCVLSAVLRCLTAELVFNFNIFTLAVQLHNNDIIGDFTAVCTPEFLGKSWKCASYLDSFFHFSVLSCHDILFSILYFFQFFHLTTTCNPLEEHRTRLKRIFVIHRDPIVIGV